MEGISTRLAAVSILSEYEKSGAFLSNSLRQYSRDTEINFPLLQKLVKGTAQWWDSIESQLVTLCSHWSTKLSARDRIVLRLAAYQLLHLDRIAEDLIFDETIYLLKNKLPQSEIAVLFRALRDKKTERGEAPSSAKTAAELALDFAHPQWLVERWIEELGFAETLELCAANNRPWPASVRVNSLRREPKKLLTELKNLKIQASSVKLSPQNILIEKLPSRQRLDQLPGFLSGNFQVQDASATLIGTLLAPRPNDRVLDLCAAPGGKTTHCGELMRNKGQIIAIDLHASKLELIVENAQRLGIEIISTEAVDARNFKINPLADRVLLDAPCSGFGTLGRKVEIRWTKDEGKLAELCALQRELLANAASLVRPGGFLVYSTCTLLRQENEEQIAWFLEKFPEFELCRPPKTIPREVLTEEGFVKTWPHRHQMGGAFGALLHRKKAQTTQA